MTTQFRTYIDFVSLVSPLLWLRGGCYVGNIVFSLFENFGRTLEVLRENFGSTSGELRENFGSTSGELRKYFRRTSEVLWKYFGSTSHTCCRVLFVVLLNPIFNVTLMCTSLQLNL
jgi:hypothetical protein